MTAKLGAYLAHKHKKNPPPVRKGALVPRRIVIAKALDMRPTLERQSKADYEGHGKKRRRADTLAELERKGHIAGEHKKAAERWAADFILAMEGYADFFHDIPSERAFENTLLYGKGDAITMEMGKGQAWARIAEVRASLGLCAHLRLQAMLIGDPRSGRENLEPMSFPAMGAWLYPSLSRESARKKISAQCAFLLEQLAEFYRNQKNEKKRLTAGTG